MPRIGIGIGVSLAVPPGLGIALGGGGVPAPYPAPAGYRWDFVTEDGQRVTENSTPVVELVRAA